MVAFSPNNWTIYNYIISFWKKDSVDSVIMGKREHYSLKVLEVVMLFCWVVYQFFFVLLKYP